MTKIIVHINNDLLSFSGANEVKISECVFAGREE